MALYRQINEKRKQYLNEDRLMEVLCTQMPDLSKNKIVDMLIDEDPKLITVVVDVFKKSIDEYMVI